MPENYRLWVKYPAVPITALMSSLPGDFFQGEHGILWIDIDSKRWFSGGGDSYSARLAMQQFGAVNGTLGWVGSDSIEMYAGDRLVGTFSLATLKTINLQGVIGTKTKQLPGAIIPGTAVSMFTEGLYFRRPPVWADKSTEEKLGELLTRAKKYAGAEVSALIEDFLRSIPLVVAIVVLLCGLGALAGAAVAGVVALIAAWGGYVIPRGMEYADRLKVVDEVLRSSSPHDTELEQGARALADFFRMVVEDCAFAAVMRGGQMAVAKFTPKPNAEVLETVDQAFTRHQAEEFQRAAKRAAKKYNLPVVDRASVPPIWLEKPLPLCTGPEMIVYRGLARNAQARLGKPLDPGDLTGGKLSREVDAAQDAVFNWVGRDPVLSGSGAGGVIRVHISADVWNELVRTNSISERPYPGFSGRLKSTEIRVNSPEAAMLINQQRMELLPPDRAFDFRGRSR
jgi:hypothetical protein